jgi:hypothetical protein
MVAALSGQKLLRSSCWARWQRATLGRYSPIRRRHSRRTTGLSWTVIDREWTIATIISDDVLMLPHRANPVGWNFRETQHGARFRRLSRLAPEHRPRSNHACECRKDSARAAIIVHVSTRRYRRASSLWIAASCSRSQRSTYPLVTCSVPRPRMMATDPRILPELMGLSQDTTKLTFHKALRARW